MALAIEILLAAAILLAVGLVAVGRLDGMSRAVPDAPPGLDATDAGDVSPAALRAVRFPVVLRGYRMRDVDEALERAALELEAAYGQVAARSAVPAEPTPIALYADPARPGPDPDPGPHD